MTISRRHFLGAAASGAALISAPAILRAQPGREDARLLERAYTLMHPGLYRYASPRQVAARFARLREQLGAAATLPERYLALSRLAGTVRCGHTYANFFNQSDAVQARLFGGRDKLPFRFRWLGERMLVTADPENLGLAAGTEILRIDGRPVSEILRALMPLARADGGNDAKRRALLGVGGIERYESFDVYFPLVFTMQGAEFTLLLRPPRGPVATLRAAPIDLARRQATMRAPQAADRAANPGWTLEHRGGAAIMAVNNWALYNSRWDWRAWLAESFAAMARRGSRALILDLRDNEGGQPECGNAVLARLIDAPLRLTPYDRRVRFREAPRDLIPVLDTWDRSFDRIGLPGVDRGDGFLSLPPDEDETVIRPIGPRFAGRLFVLTSAQNSSATFQFAAIVRANRLGTLIGGATGGNRRGINGGAYYFLRLPESGLEIDLPLIGYFPPTPQPDAGVMPDVAVGPTPEDIAAGRDPVLERALEMAR